jgi:rfaE bifunctional protein nucleotidyltransferase chain/domain
MRDYKAKILERGEARVGSDKLHSAGKTLVFTNGCFDILHAGHVEYLAFARAQGDALMIGLNSDASIRRIKGNDRPFVSESDRASLLAGLEAVDYVVVFNEDEPADLIAEVVPDVLVKGSDWQHYVSGRDTVENNGGKVVLAKMTEGLSTTALVARIRGEKVAPAAE